MAREYLGQSYTTIIFENIVMQEKVWIVELNVGFLNKNLKKVKIDVDTCKIISCS